MLYSYLCERYEEYMLTLNLLHDLFAPLCDEDAVGYP